MREGGGEHHRVAAAAIDAPRSAAVRVGRTTVVRIDGVAVADHVPFGTAEKGIFGERR